MVDVNILRNMTFLRNSVHPNNLTRLMVARVVGSSVHGVRMMKLATYFEYYAAAIMFVISSLVCTTYTYGTTPYVHGSQG